MCGGGGCPSAGADPSRSATGTPNDSAETHPRSGFRFPVKVGPFVRVNLQRYDERGDNVSAGYNLVTGELQVAATVYVYPAPVDVKVFPLPSVGEAPAWFVERHLDQVEREIFQAHPTARRVSADAVQLSQASRRKSGRRCVYAYTEPFNLPGIPQPLRSELYLFTHGPWFIKYRFTYPEPEAAAGDAITSFMQSLAWPR